MAGKRGTHPQDANDVTSLSNVHQAIHSWCPEGAVAEVDAFRYAVAGGIGRGNSGFSWNEEKLVQYRVGFFWRKMLSLPRPTYSYTRYSSRVENPSWKSPIQSLLEGLKSPFRVYATEFCSSMNHAVTGWNSTPWSSSCGLGGWESREGRNRRVKRMKTVLLGYIR